MRAPRTRFAHRSSGDTTNGTGLLLGGRPWWARGFAPGRGGRHRRLRSTVVGSALATVIIAAGILAPTALANDTQPRFDLGDPAGGPFPSNRWTVQDASQLTGLRVDLPKPDCNVRPSDCDDVDVLNTLDGFNLQPRLSIPFTAPIDLGTVSSQTVFLCKLQGTVCPGGNTIGINQVVWDPEENTLHAESDQFLDQGARYLLVVTTGIRDPGGDRIEHDQFQEALHSRSVYTDQLLAAVRSLKDAGIPPGHIGAASIFTTESVTAVMEKIRDQIEAATPAPAEFLLGTGGERTVFPFASVTSIAFRRQITTAPTFGLPTPLPIGADGLNVIPGAVGTIAFGRYSSPDYETPAGVIPAVGTRTGTPAVQGTNEIYFNLFLPSGPVPPGGWPAVIAGHGANGNKNRALATNNIAAKFAQHGLATININAVGHGGGPLGTLTVTKTDANTVTLPAGGRSVDLNGDGLLGLSEGLSPRLDGPEAIVTARDGFRQTDADLMQLVREIQVGMDVDGDSAPDLDPSRIYYFGSSISGILGTGFVATEPDVRAGVLSAAGGPWIDVGRYFTLGGRAMVGQALAARNPSLANGGPDPIQPTNPFPFNENLPLRNQPPVVNDIPGAIPIQELIERVEWAGQSGDPVALAPYLRKEPLGGAPPKPVLFYFTQGDGIVRNFMTTALLRASDLKDRTMYFRGLDAYSAFGVIPDPLTDLHDSLITLIDEFRKGFALAGQESVATFLASDGQVTLNPDGGVGQWFETPIAGPLPGEP
jgi:hypothetical protein